MAKVKAPLISLDASGNLNRVITYTSSKQTKIVKKFVASPDAQTENQIILRTVFEEGKDAWNLLTEEEKQVYNARAEGQALTGYNIFMSEYINQNYPPTETKKYGEGLYGQFVYG